MSTISLRVPDYLHRKAKNLSKRNHVSLNMFLANALAEKIAAIETVELLENRARKGEKISFNEAFAGIPDSEPEEYDRITPKTLDV